MSECEGFTYSSWPSNDRLKKDDERQYQERLKAIRKSQGPWYPANGGTERPFETRRGFTLLYCYQPSTGKHAYLDCKTDIILSDDEALLALGVYD